MEAIISLSVKGRVFLVYSFEWYLIILYYDFVSLEACRQLGLGILDLRFKVCVAFVKALKLYY